MDTKVSVKGTSIENWKVFYLTEIKGLKTFLFLPHVFRLNIMVMITTDTDLLWHQFISFKDLTFGSEEKKIAFSSVLILGIIWKSFIVHFKCYWKPLKFLPSKMILSWTLTRESLIAAFKNLIGWNLVMKLRFPTTINKRDRFRDFILSEKTFLKLKFGVWLTFKIKKKLLAWK